MLTTTLSLGDQHAGGVKLITDGGRNLVSGIAEWFAKAVYERPMRNDFAGNAARHVMVRMGDDAPAVPLDLKTYSRTGPAWGLRSEADACFVETTRREHHHR